MFFIEWSSSSSTHPVVNAGASVVRHVGDMGWVSENGHGNDWGRFSLAFKGALGCQEREEGQLTVVHDIVRHALVAGKRIAGTAADGVCCDLGALSTESASPTYYLIPQPKDRFSPSLLFFVQHDPNKACPIPESIPAPQSCFPDRPRRSC